MAVNLISSNDINITQSGSDIQLEFANLDSSVSTSSTNPVQNQAITNYVDTEVGNVAGDIPTTSSDLPNDSFKFRLYSNSATVPANGEISIDMGLIDEPTGYEYLGCIPISNGYGDQWVVSYGLYNTDHIFAKIISTWGGALTSTISCYVVYINSSIKSQYIL